MKSGKRLKRVAMITLSIMMLSALNISTVMADEDTMLKGAPASVKVLTWGIGDEVMAMEDASIDAASSSAVSETGTDDQTIIADEDVPLASMVPDSSALAGSSEKGKCHSHWGIIAVTIIGLVVAYAAGIKTRKHFIIPSMVTLVVNLVLGFTGTCNLDWAFVFGGLILTIVAFASLIHRYGEDKF